MGAQSSSIDGLDSAFFTLGTFVLSVNESVGTASKHITEISDCEQIYACVIFPPLIFTYKSGIAGRVGP